MSETSQILKTIKRLLKAQGMNYADLALKLDLSEPSVKRLFSSERLTLDRLEQLANVLGYSLSELIRETAESQTKIESLTEAQEKELVSDIRLLLVAVCVVNQWSMKQIVARYILSEQECLVYLLRLDKLRIIDLLPNNRIRLNLSRNFDWRPMGPIRCYFMAHSQDSFLLHPFDHEFEILAFQYTMLTDQAQALLSQELQRLRSRVTELHEESLAAPLSHRKAVGVMLATRTWEPVGFAELRRSKT